MKQEPYAFFIHHEGPMEQLRSNGTVKVQYGQSQHPSRNRQPAHASCLQKRKNVKHLENLKYTLSETNVKLYAILEKPDVKWSLMCSNKNVWGNYYQIETCWILYFFQYSTARWDSITPATCSDANCLLHPLTTDTRSLSSQM